MVAMLLFLITLRAILRTGQGVRRTDACYGVGWVHLPVQLFEAPAPLEELYSYTLAPENVVFFLESRAITT